MTPHLAPELTSPAAIAFFNPAKAKQPVGSTISFILSPKNLMQLTSSASLTVMIFSTSFRMMAKLIFPMCCVCASCATKVRGRASK